MIQGQPLLPYLPFDVQRQDFANNIALIHEDKLISYQELDHLVTARKAQWQTSGLQPHQLAALTMAPTPDTVISYLAALQMRVPLLLLDPDAPEALTRQLMRQLQAGWLLQDGSPPLFLHDTPACRSDLALLLSTSGSSGSPKSVMLSYLNITSNAASIAQYLQIRQDDVAISSLPLHYSYGLSVLNSQLHAGASIVLNAASLISKPFWELVSRHRVTSLSGVPFQFQMLKRMRLEQMSLPSLRYLTQAGGKLAEDDIKIFHTIAKNRGWDFYVMYGQTEASPRLSFIPPHALPQAAGTIGQPIPGGSLLLRDPVSQQPITNAGEEGELCYTGPNVMLGYARSHADLQGIQTLNELRTGDLAIVTSEGWFKITGRMSRLLKLHGKRWQLDHLEEQLRLSFAEVLCCTGEDDKLLIILSEDTCQDAIKQHLHQSYGIHPTLFKYVVRPDLPYLTNGKVDYQSLISGSKQV